MLCKLIINRKGMFALPVMGSNGEVERYNAFHAAMIFRKSKDGKKYLWMNLLEVKTLLC